MWAPSVDHPLTTTDPRHRVAPRVGLVRRTGRERDTCELAVERGQRFATSAIEVAPCEAEATGEGEDEGEEKESEGEEEREV